jgi:hypothetical protein
MPAISVPGAIIGSSLIGAGGSIFSSILGASGASKSAKAIEYASNLASKTALELNTRSRADLQPFRDLGAKSGAMLSDLFSGKTNISDLYKTSSLYNFESELGTRAMNRQLSARGMYGSGAGLESLALFDKSLVAEEGNRYFDQLFRTTALGESAAAQQAERTTSTGNNLADIQLRAGVGIGNAYADQYNAFAAGGKGVAGALRGGVSDYLSMQYLDRFFPPGSVQRGPSDEFGFGAKQYMPAQQEESLANFNPAVFSAGR